MNNMLPGLSKPKIGAMAPKCIVPGGGIRVHRGMRVELGVVQAEWLTGQAGSLSLVSVTKEKKQNCLLKG
jgi:hypothetical protein